MPEGDTVWHTAATLRQHLAGQTLTRCDIRVPQFATVRALPLCPWPAWPHYKSGPANVASSFTCAP